MVLPRPLIGGARRASKTSKSVVLSWTSARSSGRTQTHSTASPVVFRYSAAWTLSAWGGDEVVEQSRDDAIEGRVVLLREVLVSDADRAHQDDLPRLLLAEVALDDPSDRVRHEPSRLPPNPPEGQVVAEANEDGVALAGDLPDLALAHVEDRALDPLHSLELLQARALLSANRGDGVASLDELASDVTTRLARGSEDEELHVRFVSCLGMRRLSVIGYGAGAPHFLIARQTRSSRSPSCQFCFFRFGVTSNACSSRPRNPRPRRALGGCRESWLAPCRPGAKSSSGRVTPARPAGKTGRCR